MADVGTSQVGSDLLTGCEAIATHLNWTVRQVKHRVATGELPTIRIGRAVCARRSELETHFARASSARKSAIVGAAEPSADPAPVALLYGHRAIAAHLGLLVADVASLDLERRLPTYLDDGCTVASTVALDHWNSMKGGR